MSRRVVIGIVIILVLSIILAIAGFILFSIQLTKPNQTAQITASPTPLEDPYADTDKDGLIDSQEKVWGTDVTNPDTDADGYLDGKEVAANHNPLIKGPNDKLTTSTPITDAFFSNTLDLSISSKNLTEEYAKQVPDKDKSPITLSQFISAQPIITQLPSVNEAAIVTQANSSLAMSQYMNTAGDIDSLADKARLSIALNDFFDSKNTYGFTTLAEAVEASQSYIKLLKVPKDAVAYHKLLLGYTELLASTFRQIADYPTDQVKAMVALRQLDAIDRIYYPKIVQEQAKLLAITQ